MKKIKPKMCVPAVAPLRRKKPDAPKKTRLSGRDKKGSSKVFKATKD